VTSQLTTFSLCKIMFIQQPAHTDMNPCTKSISCAPRLLSFLSEELKYESYEVQCACSLLPCLVVETVPQFLFSRGPDTEREDRIRSTQACRQVDLPYLLFSNFVAIIFSQKWNS